MYFTLLSLVILFCIAGFKEGILYSKRGAESFYWNEHILFVFERSFWLILLLSSALSDMHNIDFLFLIFISILSFSFFHEWFYNISRKKIDLKNRIKNPISYSSKSSTAVINFNFKQRLFMLLLSLLFLLIHILIPNNVLIYYFFKLTGIDIL